MTTALQAAQAVAALHPVDPKPTNVVAALAAVMEDMPGIARTVHQPSAGQTQGVKYAFRGINEITGEVQRLFSKYGVVVVPKVKHRMVNDLVVNGNPWTDTFLEVDWSIYGPGGVEDRIDATTFGVGRDNTDKGTNKAMTQAFKYLLLDMLCISDPADDNDGTNQAADGVVRKANGEWDAADRHRESYVPTADRAYTSPATPTHESVNGVDIPLSPPMQTTRSGPPSDLCTEKQANYAKALLLGAGITEDASLRAWFGTNDLGVWPDGVKNLSKVQAARVIELLKP